MISILEKFNIGGFRWFNDLAGHNVWLDRFMVFAADKMGYLLILLVLVLFWKKDYFKKVILVSWGAAFIGRFVFVSIARYFLYSPRPFLILENVNQLMNHEIESSFPSGHATFYFALATTIFLTNRRWGSWYLGLTTLVVIARVIAGVHWPLDILGGAAIGILSAVLVHGLLKPHLKTLQDSYPKPLE